MQTIDISVSQAKFKAELEKYYSAESTHSNRGILLLHAEFPNIILAFTARKLCPVPIVFAVRINFDNYDLHPLSVRFIDPFTRENLINSPVPLLRKIIYPDKEPELHLLAQKDLTGLPFICLPGIREYHVHPAHTGNFWLLYRNKSGEGSLGFIIDKLYEYGISGISNYQIQAQLQIQVPHSQIFYDPNNIPE